MEKGRRELVVKLLDAYGQAFRWDWSSIDGRHVQRELGYIEWLVEDDGELPSLADALMNIGVRESEFGGFEWDQ